MGKQYLAVLTNALKAKSREMLADGGSPTCGQLVMRAQADLSSEIEAAKDSLVEIGVRQIVQRVLHGYASGTSHEDQFILPLEISHIKKIGLVSVPFKSNSGEDEIAWKKLEDLQWANLEAHDRMLAEGIDRDIASLKEWQDLMKFYRPLMANHPNRTLGKATEIYQKRRKK